MGQQPLRKTSTWNVEGPESFVWASYIVAVWSDGLRIGMCSWPVAFQFWSWELQKNCQVKVSHSSAHASIGSSHFTSCRRCCDYQIHFRPVWKVFQRDRKIKIIFLFILLFRKKENKWNIIKINKKFRWKKIKKLTKIMIILKILSI